MKSLLTFLTILFLSSTTMPVHAWWAKGHMTVTEIAKRNLKPDVLEKVELCVSAVREMGQFSRSPDMVESAPWADDLKAMGVYTMSSWHFVNTPYIPDDLQLDVSPVDPSNLESIITQLHTAIKDPKTTADIVATSVMNLIHYVGDIHQPLHSANLYSQEYPTGDKGGNLITVFMAKGEKKPINLHSFWDSMAEGTSQKDDPRPLSIANRKAITDFAAYLMAQYPFTEEEKHVTNSTVMKEESYNLAVSFVYKDIVNGTTLTDEYKARTKLESEKRVALGGYRLAAVLNDALSDVPLATIAAGLKRMETVYRPEAGTTTGLRAKKKNMGTAVTVGMAMGFFVVGVILSGAISLALLSSHSKRSNRQALYI